MEIWASEPDWSLQPGERRDQLGERLHVWLLDSETVPSHEVVVARASLSTDEVSRWKRYVRASDQNLFLIAHVFVRRVLSLYAEVAPELWDFVTNEHGRPEIEPALQVRPALRFNLSHTPGRVAVLVHDQTNAGIDVEQIGRVRDPRQMSTTVFADQERATLDDLDLVDLEARFYRYWTLKESFIKAKGMGLAIPLKDFWFSIDNPESITVDCLPAVDPNPEAWRFGLMQPTDTHLVAVACAAPGRAVDVFSTERLPPLR